MGKINWTRVFLGGLLAGLVVNLGEMIMGMIFSEQYQAAMQAIGKTMEMDAAAMVSYILYGFVYGIFAIWLYAAIRPRYGAGPKTAVCAGTAAWFIGYLMTSLGYGMMGIWPTRLLIIGVIVGFVETVLGTLAGAWIYKEAQ